MPSPSPKDSASAGASRRSRLVRHTQAAAAPFPPSPSKDQNSHPNLRLIAYEDTLPTELWRLILSYIPTLDLFSLYNTSTYMRSLSASLLVQAVGSKCPRLYFYQEYVPRVNIKLVFDHFDLERDRVVFRPILQEHQYRFRCSLTLQNPQLEEIGIESFRTTAIMPQEIQCDEGRYFTVKKSTAESQSSKPFALVSGAIPTIALDTGSTSSPTTTTATTATATATPTATSLITLPAAAVTEEATDGQRSGHRKRTADERVYQGTKNFLDKTCPVPIRKDGVQEVDGRRFCFLKSYPWSLGYHVSCSPFEMQSTPIHGQGSVARKRDQFFYDIRGDLRSQSQDENGGIVTPREESQLDLTHSTTLSKTTDSSGPRYFRLVQFECSMNFLDPKRATRNVVERWLDAKVQHWKKVLGGKKQQSSVDVTGAVERGSAGTTGDRVIHVIDGILGSQKSHRPPGRHRIS
ncbi:hypothetical protein BGZ99_003479 [Dissophora globulifera]|uniref:F-box domain-containing protein n=1 Tax=Dissophora globulifera TaxID=979702 RepID=A0A9P6RTB7_9FUNG|nr:hypothetical protein BGZ99_003479 [Dissophora globulifera]